MGRNSCHSPPLLLALRRNRRRFGRKAETGRGALPGTGHTLRYLVGNDWMKQERAVVKWSCSGVIRGLARRLKVEGTIGWLWSSRNEWRHIQPGEYDVVLASGPPFSAFRLASAIAQKAEAPLVLDYRDPWTLGHPNMPASIYATWDRAAEHRITRKAAAACFVSDSQCEHAVKGFPHLNGKSFVIPNGYDPKTMAGVHPADFGHPALAYTGRFYPPDRSAVPIMQALQIVHQANGINSDSWRFHYYGPDEAHVREEAAQNGISSRVVVHGSTPREEVLRALAGSRAAVVVTSVKRTPRTWPQWASSPGKSLNRLVWERL